MDAHKKELINAYKSQPLIGGVCIIRNTANGRYLLEAQTNPSGSKNRFAFAQMTNSCVHPQMQADWKTYGNAVFVFEVLEELTQGETQTPAEFAVDIATLGELWAERFDPALAYAPLKTK